MTIAHHVQPPVAKSTKHQLITIVWCVEIAQHQKRTACSDNTRRGENIIAIDTREQNGEYIKSVFEKHGVESEIATLPYTSGCDYLISNTCGTCGIQRKDSVKELILQMEELRYDILPRLINFTDNPVLLVEESHILGEDGNLFRKEGSVYLETGMHSKSYYGFLETVRMMGVDVVCTRNLDASIWYMIAMDGYLEHEHYPKHIKSFKPHQQALGMLACIPKVGATRAMKALEGKSIVEMYRSNKVEGLTDTMLKKLKLTMESKL